MKGKKLLALVLACMMLLGCLGVSAAAAQPQETEAVAIMATDRFNVSIPANSAKEAGVSFSLAAGEVVTIKATYAPFNASVDFGLIAPNGLFYGLSGSDGVFDEGIQVSQTGLYRLAIRNRSSVAIDVSGYVNY